MNLLKWVLAIAAGVMLLGCILRSACGFQLMTPAKLALCKASLPAMPKQWQDVFDSPDTLYYTQDEIPAAYQMGANGSFACFHSPLNNISGDPTDAGLPDGYGGNGNVNFPWQMPGGTDNAEGRIAGFKVMQLPKAKNGVPWPVVTWTGPLPTSFLDRSNGTHWMFPNGTIFGEVLLMADSKGKTHCFEIRFRVRQPDKWEVEVLRPFPTRADLAKVAEIGKPNLMAYTLEDKNPRRAFRVRAVVDDLPPMDEAFAMKLLDSTPFVSSTGRQWIEVKDGLECWAPTTKGASIVPVGYTGSFLGTTAESCKRCHDSAQIAARYFSPGRGWYGHVRGSTDEILSFHPMDPGCISYNGGMTPPRLRSSLIQAGLVAQYNPAVHKPERYTLFKRRLLSDTPDPSARMVGPGY